MKRKLALLASTLALSSCVQRMGVEGHELPLSGLSRTPPEGTVAQTQENEEQPPLTRALLEQGRASYGAFCLPCHGPSGHGDGMIVQRGFLPPPSYHQDRLRNEPDRHFFDVITHGFGAMYAYGDRVPPQERWAIVAYVRALQLSQQADERRLSPADLKALGGP